MHLTKVQGMNPQGTAWSPTLDELLSPQLQVVNKKEDASGTVYAKLTGNYRRNENVIEKWCFVLDIDKSPYDVRTMLTEGLQGFQGCFHTTYSHDPKREMYCYRVILPTDKSVAPDDYETAFLNLVDSNETLSRLRDEGILDMTAKDKGRFYYDFSCPPDREDFAYIHKLNGGTPYIADTRKSTTANSASSGEPVITQRNMSLTKEAGRLISLHKHKPTVVREALAFNEKFNPPLDIQEAMTAINSIWKKHFKDNPNDKPLDSTQKETSKFKLITNKDYAEQEEMEWLIDGLVVKKTINMIVGASGDTKSFLALHMGLLLAHKQAFFGLVTDIDNEIPVVFNALEGAYGLKNRIEGWCKHNGLEHPVNFSVLEGNPLLNNDASVDEYIEYLKSITFKDGLLFIDTYNQATPGMNENDAGATGQVMANCQKIIRETGATIFLIHHTGKSEDSKYRGSSAIMGSLDTMIGVKRTGDNWFKWTVEKVKDGVLGTSYKYQTKQVDLGVTPKGRVKNTLIIKEGNLTKPQGQRQSLGTKQQWLYDLIKERFKGEINPVPYQELRTGMMLKMGDQVEQNKKGNLFDTKMKEYQNKKLLTVETNYPDGVSVVQLINP